MTHEPRRVSGMSPVFEKRSNSCEMRVEKRADAPSRFTGRAIVFNEWTEIGNTRAGWGFFERVAPNALTKTLRESDVRMLLDHDTSKLVARSSAGDLRLTATDEGVDVDADLDTELSYVRDAVRNLEKRRLTGMSFGFQVVRESLSHIDVEEDGKAYQAEQRTIEELRLFEVSVVTFPAYPTTEAGLRSMVSEIRSARDVQTVDPAKVDPAGDATGEEREVEPVEATRERIRILVMRSELLKARFNLKDTP